ncbi:COX15/CtaA family protein [Hymenobacter lapidiphilus]|uniref:COX15/CtaA family protein n=1 Tax=Hymenobacter lapidiphilus TaxID=2608003 RepID=A0A7Y7U438_9BACT|nr:COX15/CtaA family protein [Hymenobacter lapidiphilus]NVO29862.1 COX15/CtaA family protein [Hymenobacter lapidiphilus]
MVIPAFVRRFRFVGILTVASVYLLFLVGGIVRSTGSGMGCPDWPKCFGTWVPPTHISQLPADYKEIYTAQRVAKNKKLAARLEGMGFHQVAGDIFDHPSQYIETDFNPVKTWIEYINRLIGVLIGVFVFATVLFALPYWRRDRPVFWLALASFLLTGVQGWLGSLVVSTNLLPIMVTVHMGLALVIVGLLLYAVIRSQRLAGGTQEVLMVLPGLKAALAVSVLFTFGQIVLGTQVREEVDLLASASHYLGRAGWVDQLGTTFKVHRSFSILIVLLNAYLVYMLYKLPSRGLHRLATAIAVLVVSEIVAGITLAHFAFPAFAQPVHLTLATMLFGAQFQAMIAYSQATKIPLQVATPAVVA